MSKALNEKGPEYSRTTWRGTHTSTTPIICILNGDADASCAVKKFPSVSQKLPYKYSKNVVKLIKLPRLSEREDKRGTSTTAGPPRLPCHEATPNPRDSEIQAAPQVFLGGLQSREIGL